MSASGVYVRVGCVSDFVARVVTISLISCCECVYAEPEKIDFLAQSTAVIALS